MADLSLAIFPHPSGMQYNSFIAVRNPMGRVKLLKMTSILLLGNQCLVATGAGL